MIMKYNIKVGEKYLIGESSTEHVGEMTAYDFCDCVDEASAFDQATACDYVRGIMERQMHGFYKKDIKLFDSEYEETIVYCNNEDNAKVIGNAALSGAIMILLGADKKYEPSSVETECINLAQQPEFSDLYMESMFFE